MFNSNSRLRYTAAAMVFTAFAALTACAPERVVPAANGAQVHFSDTAAFGLGIIKPYVIVDRGGKPIEIGIRMTAASLNGLPQQDTVPPTHWIVEFPPQAKATGIDHMMINWYSHGRKPAELFGEPQIAFHFYLIPHEEVMAIDPKKEPAKARNLLDATNVPVDFIAEPGAPEEKTVPGMGLHWLDSTREFGPGRSEFNEVFVNGSWDGKHIFLEPLATRKFLLTKPQVDSPVKQPTAWQNPGMYPKNYIIRHDADTDEYVIALGGLTVSVGS